ncbi:MAG: hypothetical protein FP832_06490, partial [Nitrospirae bacterium]|nr:hypothetical protein [Nitrospirota bacterium]
MRREVQFSVAECACPAPSAEKSALRACLAGYIFYHHWAFSLVYIPALLYNEYLCILLNVNLPNVKKENIHGVKFTRQGKRIYDNAIQETYDPKGEKHFWIGG